MAAYYIDQSRSFATRIAGHGHRGIVTATAIVAITTGMIDNVDDEVALFYLPKGAVIVGGQISATDMDTNVTPTLAFDVGDSGDEDRLFAASAVGQAATYSETLARAGHLYQYTSDTLIKAYVQAVAATGAAGTLKVSIQYFVDPEFSTTAATASTTA